MKKHNKILVQELQFIRTTDLLVTKVTCIRWISILKTVKAGSMALVAILLAHFLKGIYEEEGVTLLLFLSIVFAFYCVLITFLIDSALSVTIAKKEIINDILAIRNARSQMPKSFNSEQEDTSIEN